MLTAIIIIGFLVVYAGDKSGVVWMIVETVRYLPEASVSILNGIDYTDDTPFSQNVYGAAKRLLTIRDAWSIFLEFPIMGVGFFAYSYHSPEFGTAENFYFQLLAETGLFGLSFFMIFLYLVSRYLGTGFQPGSFAYRYQIGFKGVFIAALVANLTGTLFYDQRIWGLFLFLSAIQIRLVLDHRRKVKQLK